MTIKSIPRGVFGTAIPTWLSRPRAERQPMTKYYYAFERSTGRVFRFEYPSDRELWIEQGPDDREALRATHATVRAVKDAAANGQYEWPTPVWAKPA